MASLSKDRFSISSWLMAAAFFAAAMFLYTARNNFPYYYHPDEKSKVWQIQHHQRNSHHPLMLLSATALNTAFHNGPLTEQQIVERGRGVSAFFTAVTVVAMALLARRMTASRFGALAGLLAGLTVGLFLLASPIQFKLAHFMKEDPALAMGLALTFLALHIFWEQRSERSILFAGVAAATAVSGKYVGWLIFPFALAVLHAASDAERRKQNRALFLKSFGAAFLVLNYSLIFDPSKPFSALVREMKGVIWGHHGMTKDVPHGAYIRLFLNLPLEITCLFGVFIAAMLASLKSIKKPTPPEWLILGFSLLLLTLLSFSPKSSERYFLPVDSVVWFGAGVGLVWLVSMLACRCGKWRAPVMITLWCVLIGAVLYRAQPALANEYASLGFDERLELRKWITTHLPPSAIIAEDNRVHLAVEDPSFGELARIPVTVLDDKFVADLGTLEELRAKGVTHIAVAPAQYSRFDALKPGKKSKDSFERRRAFYASLGVLKNTTPAPGVRKVWEAPGGVNSYLQPGMTLFEIVPSGQ